MIPLLILFRQQLLIHAQITVHTRQHHRGDLTKAQQPTGHKLAPTLKRQQPDRQQFNKIRVTLEREYVCTRYGHDAPLHQPGRHQHQRCLEHETSKQHAARRPLGSAPPAHPAAETHAAEEETADARETLGPAVRFRRGLVGRAEAEEDGVARLHADEGRPGVVGHAVGQARDDAADEERDGGVGCRDGVREVGADSA